jgi:hypothetical protein
MAYLSLRVLYTLLPTMTMIGQVALMTKDQLQVLLSFQAVIWYLGMPKGNQLFLVVALKLNTAPSPSPLLKSFGFECYLEK